MCSDQQQHSSVFEWVFLRPWQSAWSLHILSVTYAARIAQNWLTLMSGQPQSAKLRTPLLRLTNELRRLTPQQPSNEPRHKLWLVR